jgi:hypothetical protein
LFGFNADVMLECLAVLFNKLPCADALVAAG